jgi:CBS domain-containing protein
VALRALAASWVEERCMTWTVSDVMTTEPVAIAPTAQFKTCAKLMQIHGLTAIPVVAEEGTLVGIVSEADLLAKEAEPSTPARDERPSVKALATTVGEMMTCGPVTTTKETPLNTAASLMFEHHLKVLPVVDTAKRLVGTVTRSQVLNVFLRSDESIRREVARELRLVPEIIRGSVGAEVKDGVVHMHCDVEKKGLEELLTRLVSGIPGVVGVDVGLEPAGKLSAGSAAGVGDGRA